MARRKKNAEPREFLFTGSVELRGVQFTITALDEEEARTKAASGEYDEYDTACAETVNWEIDQRSCEPNE